MKNLAKRLPRKCEWPKKHGPHLLEVRALMVGTNVTGAQGGCGTKGCSIHVWILWQNPTKNRWTRKQGRSIFTLSPKSSGKGAWDGLTVTLVGELRYWSTCTPRQHCKKGTSVLSGFTFLKSAWTRHRDSKKCISTTDCMPNESSCWSWGAGCYYADAGPS